MKKACLMNKVCCTGALSHVLNRASCRNGVHGLSVKLNPAILTKLLLSKVIINSNHFYFQFLHACLHRFSNKDPQDGE